MRISYFTAVIICIASTSIVLNACQKEKIADLSGVGSENKSIKKSVKKNAGKILFVSNRDGNDEIYSMESDGSEVTRLTFNNVPDGRASWSANGNHIAFASGPVGARDIYVLNANGEGLRNVTNTPNADEDWPEWSPRGNQIIFSSNRDGNHEIYVSDIDGEEVRRLTNRTQDDKWPTWSPDGSLIAFQSDLGGTARTDVFVMQADGSDVTRLTFADAFDQMPAWSPDGTRIAFMSARDGNPEIYMMHSDGTNQIRITNFPGIDARPSWSRETDKIVFTSSRDFTLPSTNPKFEIYIMNPDGTDPKRLTNNNLYDDYPYIK